MISQRYNEQMGNYLAKLVKASKPQTKGNLKQIIVDVPESSYYGYLTVGKIRKENMK